MAVMYQMLRQSKAMSSLKASILSLSSDVRSYNMEKNQPISDESLKDSISGLFSMVLRDMKLD